MRHFLCLCKPQNQRLVQLRDNLWWNLFHHHHDCLHRNFHELLRQRFNQSHDCLDNLAHRLCQHWPSDWWSFLRFWNSRSKLKRCSEILQCHSNQQSTWKLRRHSYEADRNSAPSLSKGRLVGRITIIRRILWCIWYQWNVVSTTWSDHQYFRARWVTSLGIPRI